MGGGRATRPVWVVLAAAATAALLLVELPAGRLGPWQNHILDFGHVPLFAALVLTLHAAGWSLRGSLALAVAAAGAAEVVQPWVGRSGGWADFFRGAAGAAAAAAVVRARATCRARRAAYAGLALALVAWPVAEVAPYLVDTADGWSAFPVLADFRTEREGRRWVFDQATVARDGGAGRVVLHPGPEPYSAVALRPVVQDFRGHRWLCWEVRVHDRPVTLVVSVRSGAGREVGTTHVQVERRLAVGDQVVRLDLSDLGPKARPVPLDLAEIREVQLFAVRTPEPVTLDVTRVWLEP